MAGIYIHVPFCASRCIYCDFYSTTQGPEQREAYVRALCREIGNGQWTMDPSHPHRGLDPRSLPSRTANSQQPTANSPLGPKGRFFERSESEELVNSSTRQLVNLSTIYFGGGTPSQLTPSQIRTILRAIASRFDIAPDAEVTIEMNPDDVTTFFAHDADLIHHDKETDAFPHINRVSLGIQSFDDTTLRLLRRRHDAAKAVEAVQFLQELGIRNISIDLIYGLPGQTMSAWEHDLDSAFSLGVQHLSAYALSIEEGTPLWHMRNEGSVLETDDETSVAMYQRLCQRAKEAGFEHYEISNFALPGYHSRHNSSYWIGQPYYGFGPGAHSYDGRATRWANRPDLDAYISYWENCPLSTANSQQPTANSPLGPKGRLTLQELSSIEHLSDDDLYNEAVMCGLRTCQGIDLSPFESRFGAARTSYLQRMAAPHLASGALAITNGHLHLTQKSLMTSDDIMSDLMA